MNQMLRAAWGACSIALPGGTLVLAPPAAFGLGKDVVASGFDSVRRLRLILGHPEAFAALRADWDGLGLPGIAGRLADRDVVAALDAAIARGRLAVAFLPRSVDPLDRIGDTVARVAAPAASTATRAVRDMSRAERVEAALKRVPAHLSGALKEQFLGLLSVMSIAMTAATFAALAVGQFLGCGEVADAVLAGLAFWVAGLAGVRALYDMVAATAAAAGATTDAETDAAAAWLADAFVVLGTAFLTVLITRIGRKAAQARAARAFEPPPPERAPSQAASPPTRRPGRSGVTATTTSDAGGASTAATSEALTGIALARRLGFEGEQAVGISGPKLAIKMPGSGQVRIPDRLTDTTLTEVKNVSILSYTPQLHDFVAYSKQPVRSIELYVRGAGSPLGQTQLSEPWPQQCAAAILS